MRTRSALARACLRTGVCTAIFTLLYLGVVEGLGIAEPAAAFPSEASSGVTATYPMGYVPGIEHGIGGGWGINPDIPQHRPRLSPKGE